MGTEAIIVLKWVDGEQVEQDLTPYYKGPQSNFATQTWLHKTGSTLVLWIPGRIQLGEDDDVDPFDLSKLLEVWVGVRDVDGVFDKTQVLFGGYIGPTQEYKQGDDWVYEIDLLSYNHDLTTKSVTSWPMNITAAIDVDVNISDPSSAIIGYGPEYGDDDTDHWFTIGDWLAGTVDPGGFDYDGIIPAHYQRVYIASIPGTGPGEGGGIRGAFYDIPFNWGTKPRPTAVPGLFVGMLVDDAIKEILKAGSYVAADPANGLDPIRPVYWLRAIVDPADNTRLRPQFCLLDLNSLEAVSLAFSDNPGEGEYSYEDLRVNSDPADYSEVVETFGNAAEIIIEGPGEPHPRYRLVYARKVQNASDNPIVPAPYHKRRPELTGTDGPGSWESKPIIEPRLETKDQAVILAAMLGAAAMNTHKSYSFKCDVWIEEGMIITLSARVPAVDVTVMVLEVDKVGSPGRVQFSVKAGYVEPTADEILSDMTLDLLTLRHPSPYSDQYTYYSAGQSAPETQVPGYSQRNLNQPDHDSVVGRHYYAAQNRRLAMANGLPLQANGLPPANPNDPPLPTINLPAVAPAPNAVAWGGTIGGVPIPKAWLDANNGVHPIEWGRDFYEDGYQPVTLLDAAAITTAIFKVEYAEDGTVFANFVDDDFTSGLTLTLKRKIFVTDSVGTAGDYDTFLSTDIDAAHPLIVNYTHSLTAHVAGLPAGHVVNVFLSEREPDPSMFGGPALSATP